MSDETCAERAACDPTADPRDCRACQDRAHADPAALIRAAIARAVARMPPFDYAGLLTLAQALEAVNRAVPPGQPLMHGPDLGDDRLVEIARLRAKVDSALAAIARVQVLRDSWCSRDTADQWAPSELTRALRGEDPSDG